MRISLKRNKVLIIILGIIIFIGLNFYQKGIKDFFYSFSGPIQKFLWKTGQGTSGFFETIFKINSLKTELEDLRLENQKLLFEIVFLRELKKENETLREALEIDLQKEFKLDFAEIIGKDFNEDSILINKGYTEGVSEGMPVITQSKVLLGKISQVYQNFSKVMLISNKKSSLDVSIQDKEIQGIVEGKGKLALSLGLVPRDKEIGKGDLIITTSLGGIFPKGLLVGRIENVQKSDVKPVQEAEVVPFFDLNQLETVFIILNF